MVPFYEWFLEMVLSDLLNILSLLRVFGYAIELRVHF